MNIDNVQIHRELCNELNETYDRKNRDYGNSFSETFDKLGIISAITRITDKYNRLVSLCAKPEEERMVKDESISDTLMDMANYCIMTEIELRKNKAKRKSNREAEKMHEHEYVLEEVTNPFANIITESNIE